MGFVRDIEQCLKDFDMEMINARNDSGIIEVDQRQITTLEHRMREIVKFHVETRQLSQWNLIQRFENQKLLPKFAIFFQIY